MNAPETAFRPYATAIVEYAKKHDEVVCLTGDLTASCEIDGFRDTFADRYFNFGMAEQNIISIAGGMAKGGVLPYVHTFGVFTTRRPYDQVAMSVGVPRARVRMMGFLPGLTTPGGVTHQAIDDVALMSAIPNMTIVDLGDATEISSVHDQIHDVDGPVYCRVMRGDVPVLFDTPLELGKVRVLAEGADICVLSSSITTAEAIKAVAHLSNQGVSVAHIHVSTLKPFDDPRVAEILSGVKGVVTLENHLVFGGLGSAVADLIATQGLGVRLIKLGLQDTYGAGGSLNYLLDRFGMTASSVVSAAETLLGERLSDSLADSDFEHGEGDTSRQEAL